MWGVLLVARGGESGWQRWARGSEVEEGEYNQREEGKGEG